MNIISQKKIDYLLNLGFKKKYLDDNSGWWLEINIKHKLFHKPKIIIDEFNKEVIIMMDSTDSISNNINSIIQIQYSKKNLKKIFKLLNVKK